MKLLLHSEIVLPFSTTSTLFDYLTTSNLITASTHKEFSPSSPYEYYSTSSILNPMPTTSHVNCTIKNIITVSIVSIVEIY